MPRAFETCTSYLPVWPDGKIILQDSAIFDEWKFPYYRKLAKIQNYAKYKINPQIIAILPMWRKFGKSGHTTLSDRN